MDPKSLTNLDWNNIKVVVHTLWFILISVAVFGGALLIAQVFLPSLAMVKIKTGQFKSLRLLLYLLSGASFTVAILLIIQTFSQLSSLLSFYARFWM